MTNKILIWLKQGWRLLFVLLLPLILLPLPITNNSSEARCGYIVLILITYWVFELIPLPVTSLLPLVLFPLAGVLKHDKVAPSYFQDIIALFFGSLSMAYAVEYVNLHRRIALFVLSTVGTSTQWAMAGLMGVTAFLSMWINNSAAASIMLPVALAITDELQRHGQNGHDQTRATKETTTTVNDGFELHEMGLPDKDTTKEVIDNAADIEEPKTVTIIEVKQRFRSQFKGVNPHEKKYKEIKKAFLLATAYSASIGGLSSLVGTGPNVFLKGFVDKTYKGVAFRVNFLNFLLYALPVAVIMLILCWLWLQIFYNRKEFFQFRTTPESREIKTNLKAMLVRKYKELGTPQWSEYCVAVIFIIVIILWVTREFGDTKGWDILFQNEYVDDSTVAVFCGILPLIVPNSNPFKSNWKYEPIIQWNDLVKHISWSAIFLLGAGLSIALAFEESGLSETIAKALGFLTGVPQAAIIFVIIVISGLFTEVTSNLSTVTIFLPVLNSVAYSSDIHPGYLILPCTLAVSLAFMLPIATPPNAIVFASGAIRVVDMIKTGIVMNIIGFLVIFLATMTWMPKIYGIDDQATQLILSINTTTLAPRIG